MSLDPRDKLAIKETFARLEYYAETLEGEELSNLSRQLNDKLLFVKRRMAKTNTDGKRLLRVSTEKARIAAVG